MVGESMIVKLLISIVLLVGCITRPQIPIDDSDTLFVVLKCRPTRVIVNPGAASEIDTKMQRQAKKGCAERYENSKCLVEFRVLKKYDYFATCGAPIK